MPAKINGSVVTCVADPKINGKDVTGELVPDLHGEDTEERQKDSGVDGRDGFFKSMDETDTDLFALSPVVPVSREAEQYLELFPDEVSRESDEAAPVSANPCSQEDVADTQAPAQEPEQRCDEARNSVDELIASIFEDSADTQARDPQLSGDPPDSDDASPPKWKTLVKIQHLSLIVMIHNSVDE